MLTALLAPAHRIPHSWPLSVIEEIAVLSDVPDVAVRDFQKCFAKSQVLGQTVSPRSRQVGRFPERKNRRRGMLKIKGMRRRLLMVRWRRAFGTGSCTIKHEPPMWTEEIMSVTFLGVAKAIRQRVAFRITNLFLIR